MSEATGQPRPPLTVVMPIYNAESSVREALTSVLEQSFQDFELLALDDGSTDGSLTLLQAVADRRVRVVSRPHQGVVRAMNTGLELARGALIALAGAADVCLPGRLERQVAFLVANPGVALVGAAVRRGVRTCDYPSDAPRMRWRALYECPVANSTIMFRRRAALAVGGYPQDFHVDDGYSFVSRLLARYDAANLSEPLVLERATQTAAAAGERRAQVAEGDRVRRANIGALVPEPETAQALFRLLVGRPAPPGHAVTLVLDRLIAAFRRCWALDGARWRALAPWIARELFQRALLHGAVAPSVLLRMTFYAWTLDGGLVFRPSTTRALLRHVVMLRSGR